MGYSAIGTITINKIGTLTPADFTDWDITIADPPNSFNLTKANSSLDFGDASPSITILSTITSLTITLVDPTNFTSGNFSRFAIATSGSDLNSAGWGNYYSTQVYTGGTSNRSEDFGVTPSGSGSGFATGLTLTLPCANSTPLSAPIDLNFSKQPATFASEIELK